MKFEGIEKVTPAGSLRRGRETVGDLDLLATGPACEPEHTGCAVEYVAAYPGIRGMIAKGENKVSFYVEQGLQVDVRLLPSAPMALRCNTLPARRRTMWRCGSGR